MAKLKNEKGQAATEYIMILSIAVGILTFILKVINDPCYKFIKLFKIKSMMYLNLKKR